MEEGLGFAVSVAQYSTPLCGKVWVQCWLKEKVANYQIELWSALAVNEPMLAF